LNWLENKLERGLVPTEAATAIIQTLLMQAFQALYKGNVGEGSFLTSSYK